MKKVGFLLLLFLSFTLFGCATTKVSDVFRFESRGLEIKIGEEKELGIIMGDIDPNSIIIYRAISETQGLGDEIIPASDIIDLNGSSSTYYYRDTTQGAEDHVKVYGKMAGVVRFVAYLKDSPNVKDTINITVVAEKIGGYQLLSSKSTINVGEEMVLSTITLPNGLNSDAYYSSEDDSIAKVLQTGVVKGIAPGTVIISAKSKYDNLLIAQKRITVEYSNATSVETAYDECQLYKGYTFQIEANVLPNSANPKLTYTSANTKVATVDANGLITAIDAGETVITVKSQTTNVTAKVNVKVIYTGATSLNVNDNSCTVAVGSTANILYSVTPFNASQNLTIEVLSGNDNIQVEIKTVVPTSAEDTKQSQIVIKGLVAGTAQIKVSTANGYYSKVIDITITE